MPRHSDCTCYVAQLHPSISFALRWGAHAEDCPAFKLSTDPVDQADDKLARAHYLSHEPDARPQFAERIRVTRSRALAASSVPAVGQQLALIAEPDPLDLLLDVGDARERDRIADARAIVAQLNSDTDDEADADRSSDDEIERRGIHIEQLAEQLAQYRRALTACRAVLSAEEACPSPEWRTAQALAILNEALR